MLEVRTTRCQEYEHREFVLEFEDCGIPDAHVQAVVRNIEEMVASGAVFQPGQTLQVGCMVTQVQPYNSEDLTLVEPDLKSLPIVYQAGVTETLRQLMLQVFMIESVLSAEQMQLTSMLQSVVLCDRYDQSIDFVFDRSQNATESESGWFLGCLDKEHDHGEPANLRRATLYEAMIHQKGIRSFVSFPQGTTVINQEGKNPQIFQNGERLSIRKGSLLDLWMNQ